MLRYRMIEKWLWKDKVKPVGKKVWVCQPTLGTCLPWRERWGHLKAAFRRWRRPSPQFHNSEWHTRNSRNRNGQAVRLKETNDLPVNSRASFIIHLEDMHAVHYRSRGMHQQFRCGIILKTHCQNFYSDTVGMFI